MGIPLLQSELGTATSGEQSDVYPNPLAYDECAHADVHYGSETEVSTDQALGLPVRSAIGQVRTSTKI